mgnify:CR=1 FL=1
MTDQTKTRESRLAPLPGDDAVEDQQEDRPEDGSDETDRVRFVIPVQGLTDEFRDKSSRNTDDGGDDATAGVFSRHEELGNSSDDETNEESVENFHERLEGS